MARFESNGPFACTTGSHRLFLSSKRVNNIGRRVIVLKWESISRERLKRSKIVLAGIIVIFVLLALRILWIQTVDFDKYLSKVTDQITTQSPVSAERGKIYDRNGNVLATNITTYRVFISPSSINSCQREAVKSGDNVDYAQTISKGLSEILSLDYDTVLKQTGYVRYLDRTIAKNVTAEKADEVRLFTEKNGLQNMVYIEATSKRYYPNSTLASALIGFTNSDGDGLYGLEAYYNKALSGSDGYYITARDSLGNEMPNEYESYVPAENGGDLVTTVDSYIQSVLEEQLLAAVSESNAQNRACGIVIDVKTGGILAMATVPGFDLNDPWTLNEYYSDLLTEDGYAEGSEEYQAASKQYLLDMWRNKAISDSYIPGSTFKIITSSMALSENKVSLRGDSVFCGGSLRLFGYTIHCHKRLGHGSLTFSQGLQQSCNVWFMTIGQRLGISTFYKYFNSFGYLQKTGIDLPGEGNSIIKSQADMTELDLSIYAFGQNFNITPIQHISAIASVANGGYLVKPYLVERITDADGNVTYTHSASEKKQVISKDVCDELSVILEEGVSGDGGAKNAYVSGYKIAAKTGTSEKKGTEIRVDGVKPYVCSCVAYAPADDPQIAVLIMVDEPSSGILYGSVVAAPYVGKFMESVLPYIGVERDTSQESSTKVPDLVGMSLDKALEEARMLEYSVTVKGEGKYVTSQTPNRYSEIDKTNKIITLYTGDEPEDKNIKVPDLIGKTAFAVNEMLVNAKLNICIEGTDNYMSGGGATVVAQSIPAGTMVSEGTVITVTFRYLDPDDG